jgi:hypothetical protein
MNRAVQLGLAVTDGWSSAVEEAVKIGVITAQQGTSITLAAADVAYESARDRGVSDDLVMMGLIGLQEQGGGELGAAA